MRIHAITIALTLVTACATAAPAREPTAAVAPIAAAPAASAEHSAFAVRVIGAGRPMILIPGLTCSGEVWNDTAAHFEGAFEVHVLTLAGFGGEPAIAAPMLDTVREQVIAYIHERQLERPVIVGHSLGGFLALWIAATAPDAVGPVVAVDGVPYLPALMDPGRTAASSRVDAEQAREMFASLDAEAFAAQNRAGLAQMIIDPRRVDEVAESAGRSDPAAVGEALYELMVTDIRPTLAAIRTPVLMIAAAEYAKDEATRAQVRERYERQIEAVPDHRVVLATAARHFVMLDDPEFLFAQLDRFLAPGA